MIINSQFNKFYHGANLNDILRNARSITFREILDTRTNQPFEVFRYEDYHTMDEVKQLFKLMNLDYPNDEKDERLSTKLINNEQLIQHINFIIKTMGESGYEISYIKEEWDRIIGEVRN